MRDDNNENRHFHHGTDDSRSYSSYTNDNTFYRRAPSESTNHNSELMHQALLPPSRFASGCPEQNLSTSGTTVDYVMDSDRKSMFGPSLKGTLSSRRRTLSSEVNLDKETEQSFDTSKSSLEIRKKMRKNYLRRLHIPIAVLCWYLLGVISISTTKVLLTDFRDAGMSPQIITLQQFVIGIVFLRSWIFMYNGRPPHPIHFHKIMSSRPRNSTKYAGYDKLIMTAIFFTLGFWFTNLSFSNADASFVETIKASEPISSAGLAVLWRLEQMSSKEFYSLFGICIGVVISTLGHVAPSNEHGSDLISEGAATLFNSIYSSGIVMGANISFSFRGLYQKLFRASPNGNSKLIDDLNLQYRIHQVGIVAMLVPICVYELPSFFKIWFGLNHASLLLEQKLLSRFILLSILNGFAFTHYNLASSYVLTRITVVHHAALNCIRRLFAIIVTSIVFSVPITMISGLGIFVSISGFVMYTRFKVTRKERERAQLPITSAR